MAPTSNFCSIKLTPRGPVRVTRDEIKAKAKAEYQANMLAAAKLAAVSDSKLAATKLRMQQAEADAKRQYRLSRFTAHRYTPQRDTTQDPDVRRRHRKFSITRDIFGAAPTVENVYDLTRAGGGLGARRNAMSSQADPQRFLREAHQLVLSGIVDRAHLPDWEDDNSIMRFFNLVNACAMRDARDTFVGKRNRNRVIDSAPGIYLFTELLKRTEVLIEEDFTELWARVIFPIRNLNTWLPQWNYERIDDRVGFPRYVDIEQLPADAPRGSENRNAVLCGLVYFHHAASWTNLELMRYAESVANGAPNIDLSQRRINAAVRMMNWWEDILAFFGDPDVNILGIFAPETGPKGTGIERVPSGGGFGTVDTEADRNLIIDGVTRIYERTTGVLRPNTIMFSTASWLYVNRTLYGTADSNATDNRTVLSMAMETIEKLGITEVMEVPEVGFSPSEEARLLDHGMGAAEAERLAGGLDGEQTLVVMRRDPEVAELIVAKDRINYPARETRHDRVEARMLQGSGGMAFYKPEAIKIITDVGPAPVAIPPEPN